MTDAEIMEVQRRLMVDQMFATIALVEVLVVALHNSGLMEKAVFVQHVKEAMKRRAGDMDKLSAAMFEKVIADLEGGDAKPTPQWFRGIVEGGKADPHPGE